MNKKVAIYLLPCMLISFFCIKTIEAESGNENVVVIIVNKANSMENIKKHDLKDLFLGKITTIEKNNLIPVKSKDQDTYSIFRKKVLNMNKKDEKTYWLRESFRGVIKIIKQLSDSEEVINFVKEEEKGIGIVLLSDYNEAIKKDKDSVNYKVLKIDNVNFENSNYLLR